MSYGLVWIKQKLPCRILLNSVVITNVVIFGCNVNSDASGAHPVPHIASTISPDASVAVQCLADMLRVHCWKFLPFLPCPSSSVLWRHFLATIWANHGIKSLSWSPSNPEREFQEFLCKEPSKFELSNGILLGGNPSTKRKSCIDFNDGKDEGKYSNIPVFA